MEKVLLQAILNYIADHVELSNQSWAVHGIDTNDFRTNELLKLISYINPEWFDNLKAKLIDEKWKAESNGTFIEEDDACIEEGDNE